MAPMRMSLSDLPDEAIAKILSYLPIKDAVRTSVLSRFWRHRWRHTPSLDVSYLSADEVSTVLLLHSGPIRFFKAREPLEYGEGKQEWQYHNIHSWVAALSRHSASSLRTLILSFGFDVSFNIDHIACGLPNLVHLDLSCDFNVPLQFRGFAVLRSLCIHNDVYPSHDRRQFSRMISAYPLLETLTLGGDIMNTNICQDLDIVAPNLRRLDLYGLQLVDFSITKAPMLEVASIRDCTFDDDDGGDAGGSDSDYEDVGDGFGNTNIDLVKIFQSAASLKKLELDVGILTFLGRGYIPERIPINLDYLRVLSMDAAFGKMRAVLGILCLLRSAPNLQELEIWSSIISKKILKTCDDFWEAQDHIDLFKLETVTMSQMWGKKSELGFIQFLLAKARVLKTVWISFNVRHANENSVMKSLLGFPRVSCQARILFFKEVMTAEEEEEEEDMFWSSEG